MSFNYDLTLMLADDDDGVEVDFKNVFNQNQEIVISSGTSFDDDSRFKSGDIHIRKSPG